MGVSQYNPFDNKLNILQIRRHRYSLTILSRKLKLVYQRLVAHLSSDQVLTYQWEKILGSYIQCRENQASHI